MLVIVDADCQVGEGTIEILAKKSALAGCNAPKRVRPVQALYLMHAPAGAGLKQRIAEFAWIVKNQVRPLGFQRLRWPCQLMGTGMAFPWAMAVTMPLANANIVEDMKLGIELALTRGVAGRPGVGAFLCAGEDSAVSEGWRTLHGTIGRLTGGSFFQTWRQPGPGS